MIDDFLNGPANDRWFLHWTGLQNQEDKYNIAGQSRPTKQRWSFQTNGYKINNESYLVNNKCKCDVKMGLSVYITRL